MMMKNGIILRFRFLAQLEESEKKDGEWFIQQINTFIFIDI